MRILGVGLHGLNCFCSLMDLGRGFTRKLFYAAVENVYIASKTVFDSVIEKAGREEKEKTAQDEGGETNLTVSGDGSWSKRGFTSSFGVITLIGNKTSKVLDLIVKSSFCQGCVSMKSKKGTPEYDHWWEEHEPVCAINHNGSAGKMEVDGMLEMFGRADELHGTQYKRYIGDGDSKTFSALLKQFEDIEKKECINHVQKRMGSKLRSVRKENKSLGRASTGKLTMKLIRDLTTYFGLAIRRNIHSAAAMKNDIMATFYHKISTDKKPQHQYCPQGPESWCNWRRAEAEKKLKEFRHDPPLDINVQNAILPIYESLTSDDLLNRCVGGYTQNNNESFNKTVWQFAPKHINCGARTIQISSFMAASIFNEGFKPILKMLEVMGVEVGHHADAFAIDRDENRLQDAHRRALHDSREARTTRRQAKFQEQQDFEVVEGLVYGAGIAD